MGALPRGLVAVEGLFIFSCTLELAHSVKTLKTVKYIMLKNVRKKSLFFDPDQMHTMSKAANVSSCHTADASPLAAFSRKFTKLLSSTSLWHSLSITTSSCFLSCGITIRLTTFRVICRKQ